MQTIELRFPLRHQIKCYSSESTTVAAKTLLKHGGDSHSQDAKLESSSSSSKQNNKSKKARTMARIINSTPWSAQLESSLSTLVQPCLSQTTVLRTLRLLKTPSKALHFFHWAYRTGFTHTPQTYLFMLQFLCTARNFNTARNFLLSIPKKSNGSVKLEDKHFNCLIRAFGEAGIFKESLKVFQSMKSIGVSPSVVTFNSLFFILLKRGRCGIAFELYDEMLKTYGVKPDLYSFNTLIRGFCMNSMIDEGFRFFKEMEKFQCKPDVITYNTIVDGLCRTGKVKTAHNVMKGMLKKGSDLMPNVVTYTTLIRGYCGKQEIDQALNVFEEMMVQGLKPNEITYNILLRGLCEARRLEKIKEILKEFSEGNGGFVPDACTFNTLINAHCNAGNLTEGMKIFRKMLELKVQPDSVTYSMLIRGFCKTGDFKKAELLFQELSEKELLLNNDGSTPLVASYNPMFKYLCENGGTEKADRVFRQLMRRGTQDVSTFKTLIMGHCRDGTPKAGHQLLAFMLRRDFMPDLETYESLIQTLLEKGEAILAHDTLEKMLKSSHFPGTSTFHRILTELINNDCSGESFSLVMLMLEKSIRQNIKLSTGTARLLFKIGSRDKAFETVTCLYKNGYTVNMEELIIFLCEKNKLLEAHEMLLFGLRYGQRINLSLCSGVLVSLCKIGGVSEAFELYYELLEQGVQLPVSCLEDLRTALEAKGRLKEAEFVSKKIIRQTIS